MSPALRQQRLDALAALVAAFARPENGLLDDALDALLDATPAKAAAAFANDGSPRPRAERRLGDPLSMSLSGLGAALRSLADRALHAAETLRLVDLGAGAGSEFAALGARCALCVPLVTGAPETFVIVLLFDDAAMLDEETRSYVDTVAGVTVLALDRHHARSIAPRSSGPIETTRGPELELYSQTIAQEILGPAGALVLQLDELSQISEQLQKLTDPSDPAVGDALVELFEVTREMGTATTRLCTTANGLMSAEPGVPARLDFGAVVSESLGPPREQLERRGIQLVERASGGCFVLGFRRNLSRVVQQLVDYAAETTSGPALPCVSVNVFAEESSVVLEVHGNGESTAERALSDLTKPLSRVRSGGSVAIKLATEVIAAHGGHLEVGEQNGAGLSFRVVLPAISPLSSAVSPVAPPSARELPPPAGKRQRILIVDDETLFSRAIRRGLRPHDVRIAGTASEAELLLFDDSYEPDLVVCNVLLPGTNGHVLHQRVLAARPRIAARFVFVTGGALGTQEADYLRASGCATLFKPFDVGGLLELIASRSETSTVRTLIPSEPPRRTDPSPNND